MLKDNYLNRLKELPETVRQFGGIITLTIIIIVIVKRPPNCFIDSGNSFNLFK